MRRVLIALMIAAAAGCSSQPDGAQLSAPSGNLKIYGPFVHEHLSLYVVEDPSSKSAGEFITLAEGLAAGTVKVSEKKSAQVNELLIENASDKPCFVQAGDVVKGGQQDRTISRDFGFLPRPRRRRSRRSASRTLPLARQGRVRGLHPERLRAQPEARRPGQERPERGLEGSREKQAAARREQPARRGEDHEPQ